MPSCYEAALPRVGATRPRTVRLVSMRSARETFFAGWIRIGLTAGAIAIVVNTLLLRAADWMHIDIGHGGLLELVHRTIVDGVTALDPALTGPAGFSRVLVAPSFKIGFHAAVGLLMALFYTGVLEPRLPQRLSAGLKGFTYALLLWVANAAIVLPALGQGFAGCRVLHVGGMLYFAFAHTAFFLTLAWMTALLQARDGAPPAPGSVPRKPQIIKKATGQE